MSFSHAIIATTNMPLAETAPAQSSIDASTVLLVLLTGGVLFLAKTISALRRDLQALQKQDRSSVSPPATAPASPPATSVVAEASLDPSSVHALIAAAVHIALRGRHHRILAVRENEPQRYIWSLEGRRAIFSSHALR